MRKENIKEMLYRHQDQINAKMSQKDEQKSRGIMKNKRSPTVLDPNGEEEKLWYPQSLLLLLAHNYVVPFLKFFPNFLAKTNVTNNSHSYQLLGNRIPQQQ